ncbi:hypothetical protein HNQ55_000406 [Thalassotalea piscium]|uniref:Uncharacterized protein n=1 Tax=Thalassotalea piscium TaxID=1230533 RepID=A0A7X0NEF4_9GAMM|nr:hypothetical protein [Thalassotalea piscium]
MPSIVNVYDVVILQIGIYAIDSTSLGYCFIAGRYLCHR